MVIPPPPTPNPPPGYVPPPVFVPPPGYIPPPGYVPPPVFVPPPGFNPPPGYLPPPPDYLPYCGDGVLGKGEQCDDGNTRNGDGCNDICQFENVICGNGRIEGTEQCDDGNLNGTSQSYCTIDCRLTPGPFCGDGTVQEGEQCDAGPGNSNLPGTVCLENCILPYCGDGVTNSNEDCDYSNPLDVNIAKCNHFCRIPAPSAPPLTAELTPPRNIPTPAKTPTGPGLVIFLASGAAAGVGIVRKRLRG